MGTVIYWGAMGFFGTTITLSYQSDRRKERKRADLHESPPES